MKKLILLTIAAVLSTGAFAQRYNNTDLLDMRGWDWGVKAGVNFSNASNIDSDTKMMTRFYAGLFAEFRMNYWFGIQPEVYYSAQGVTIEPANNLKYELKQDYINVPILAKFYVLDNLSVNIGPQFGFLVNDDVKLKSGSSSTTFGTDTKGFDFSVAMGLNYTIMNHLDITARYNLGLTDVYGDLRDTNRNGVIQVGLGYRF